MLAVMYLACRVAITIAVHYCHGTTSSIPFDGGGGISLDTDPMDEAPTKVVLRLRMSSRCREPTPLECASFVLDDADTVPEYTRNPLTLY